MIASVPSAPFPFRQVALVGFGLMGGSLGRALKALPRAPRVQAWAANPQDLEEGMAAGALDGPANDPAELFRGSDLVVYATPMGGLFGQIEEHRGLWEADAVVTDLASLKAPVRDFMEKLGEGRRYVGSHPMAGGEGRGFGASRQGLYQGATVWLTAGSATGPTRARLEAFWTALGARPRWAAAEEHDRRMAWISHLPQLTANALATVLDREGLGRDELGPGGRDMTRLAGSSSEMWSGILSWAGPELCRALASMERALAELRRTLETGEVERIVAMMERNREWFGGGSWK